MPSRRMSRSRLTRAMRDDALIRALLAEGERQLAREAAARAYGWITRNGRLPVAGAAAGYAAQFAALAWLRPAERAA